jgi:hypothetical protein
MRLTLSRGFIWTTNADEWAQNTEPLLLTPGEFATNAGKRGRSLRNGFRWGGS